MEEELVKLKDGGIIKPTRYSTWVSNLVLIRKKNGDIRLYVDFRNLNMSSLKDNYPVPNMESILQKFGWWQSYVVYLGGHHDGRLSAVEVADSHYELLSSVLGSKEVAKDSIFYSYTKTINGFAAKLPENHALALKKHPGVISVFPNSRRKLQTTHSWAFLGLEDVNRQIPPQSLWRKSNFGKDVIIANFDSGVWPESESFSDKGFGPVPSRWKGICENSTGFTCNRKLIGARYFHKGFEAENGPLDPKAGEQLSARDDHGHGSHTLSTAGGTYVEKANVLRYGHGVAKGGAPAARVATYKVCWSNGSAEFGCYDADILAAFDQGIYDGVDVISISLGGIQGALLLLSDGVSIGSLHAVQKGRVVVCSAGNDGPSAGTVLNVAPWVITVGASTTDRQFASVAFLGNKTTCKGQSLSQFPLKRRRMYPLVSSIDVRGRGVNESAGESCYPGSLDPRKVKDKIVACELGINPRVEKGEEVRRAGGAGMILYNDIGEGDSFVADAHVLPATEVEVVDGLKVLDYIKSTKSPVAYISPVRTEFNTTPAPLMTSFTSLGPTILMPGILKPDIAAPGLNILAAWSGVGSPTGLDFDHRKTAFNVISGTSMACPHVAGVAALLKAAYPQWSPAAISSAIMTSATIMDDIKGAQNVLWNPGPFAFGAGHINPNRAGDPGLIYDLSMNDYYTVLCILGWTPEMINRATGVQFSCPADAAIYNLNYPSITAVSLDEPRILKRTVTYVSNGPETFKAEVRSPPEVVVAVKPNILHFTKTGEVKSFEVVMRPKPSLRIFGFGSLTWKSAKHVVRSPIVVCSGNCF
ncbi:subtilisin-like protease SBT5.3 [Cryptomeria japonica]|uniref:subtilisin-like protease SBT5.3 n=1 Tax=Cryptomeria japonica TaxID=3369 RepID=UPI0027DA9DE3|nr:subtilisin-like protease SBT5.3 [Cryptomeria japonica]